MEGEKGGEHEGLGKSSWGKDREGGQGKLHLKGGCIFLTDDYIMFSMVLEPE